MFGPSVALLILAVFQGVIGNPSPINYEIDEMLPVMGVGAPASIQEDGGFTLTTVADQSNYANCDGDYVPLPSEATIRGQPLYYNAAKERIAFYTGSRWVITSSTNYLSVVVLKGATGGFYGSQKGKDPINCSDIWLPRYTATAL